MRFLYSFILVSLLAFVAGGQSPSALKLRCPNPYGSFYGTIVVQAGGDIIYTPCPVSASIFYRDVDFSHATVTGLPFTVSPLTTKGDLWGFAATNARVPVGADGTVLTANSLVANGVSYKTLAQLNGVTGTGTTNFVPRWTSGAGGVIGNTPFSWNGTVYTWTDTPQTATWIHSFTPDSSFVVGDAIAIQEGYLQINRSGGAFLIGGTTLEINTAGGASGQVTFSNLGQIDFTAGRITFGGQNTALLLDGNGTGLSKLGDVNGNNSSTLFTVDDNTKFISADSRGNGIFAAGDVNGAGQQTKISADDSSQRITLNTTSSGFFSDGIAHTTTIGDYLGVANSTTVVVDDVSEIVTLGSGHAALVIDKSGGTRTISGTAGNSINWNSSIVQIGDLIGLDNFLSVNDNANAGQWTQTSSIALDAPAITTNAGTINASGAALTVASCTGCSSAPTQGTVLSVPLSDQIVIRSVTPAFGSFCNNGLLFTSDAASKVACPVTRAGTIRNLYVRTGTFAKVNTPTTVITISKNGVATAVTLTMTETVTTTTADTTHSFAVVAGDLISIEIAVSGAAAFSTGIVGITFELD